MRKAKYEKSLVNLNLTTSLRSLHPLLKSIVTQKTGVSSEMAG
jgi:hypothetical protein